MLLLVIPVRIRAWEHCPRERGGKVERVAAAEKPPQESRKTIYAKHSNEGLKATPLIAEDTEVDTRGLIQT